VNEIVGGLFVGGRGSRMGGQPKGLLRTPGGATIIARSRAILESLGVPLVLVGAHEAYAGLGIETVADEPAGIGPLGGLVALLCHAGARRALALAGDMALVSPGLLRRLLDGRDAAIVAPRREGRWEPLCAVYDAERVLPIARRRAASNRHSLQSLLDEVGATELPLSAAETREMHDWDTPEDLRLP
jgi:molybdopterin-guanine dinucleotide biosynthesis protein A